MIVLDASAALDLLLGTTPAAAGALDRVLADSLHAPELIDLEIASALRRFVQMGELTPEQARARLDAHASIRIERYRHAPLLPRIWQLRDQLTAYDASYVALAEALGCSLLTSDAALARARGHGARVELLA